MSMKSPIDGKPTRGGKRAGAGRKPRAVPLKALAIRIEGEDLDKLKSICKATGNSQAGQITKWIRERADQAK